MKRSPLISATSALLGLALVAASTSCAGHLPSQSEESAPAAAFSAQGTGGAVVSDTVQSTQAGISVLAAGGSAADAAVTVAATLGVTDPFVSGLGGGGYLVCYEAKTGKVSTIDGRETARAADGPTLFLDPTTGKPLSATQANVGGIAVGVPGQLALWKRALDRWGKRGLTNALTPAVELADRGFPVTTALHNQIADSQKTFGTFSTTSAT